MLNRQYYLVRLPQATRALSFGFHLKGQKLIAALYFTTTPAGDKLVNTGVC